MLPARTAQSGINWNTESLKCFIQLYESGVITKEEMRKLIGFKDGEEVATDKAEALRWLNDNQMRLAGVQISEDGVTITVQPVPSAKDAWEKYVAKNQPATETEPESPESTEPKKRGKRKGATIE